MVELGAEQYNWFGDFRMDCWKDTVYYAGKCFPAGTFAAEILNCVKGPSDHPIDLVSQLCSLLDQVGPDKICDLEKFFADVNAVLRESFSWLCGVPPFCYDDEFLEGYILGAPSSTDLFHEQIENDPDHLPGTLMYYGLEMIKVLLSAYQFALLTQAFEKKYLHSLKSRRESDFARVSNLCFQEDLTFASLICKMPYHPFVSYDPSPKLAMEFVTVKNPDDSGTLKLVNRVSFSQLIDLLTYDLMNGMEHGHAPARCQNCKRYFLTTNARTPKYCDGQAPQNPAMTCRQYGAMHHQKEQNQNHPVYKLFNTKTNTIRKHYQREKITAEDRAAALSLAAEYRDQALMDNGYARSGYLADMELEHIYEAIKRKG